MVYYGYQSQLWVVKMALFYPHYTNQYTALGIFTINDAWKLHIFWAAYFSAKCVAAQAQRWSPSSMNMGMNQNLSYICYMYNIYICIYILYLVIKYLFSWYSYPAKPAIWEFTRGPQLLTMELRQAAFSDSSSFMKSHPHILEEFCVFPTTG